MSIDESIGVAPLRDSPFAIAAIIDTESDPAQERVALLRVASLSAAGCDVEAFAIDASSAFEARLTKERIAVHRLGRQLHADWASVRDLAVACRHKRPRALYCMGRRAHERGAIAKGFLNVPTVLHPYATPSFRDLSLARLTGSTLFVSTEGSLGHARLASCHAILVTPSMTLQAREERAAPREPCIGWVGAWRDVNNPGLFERAAEALARERHDLTFAMVVLGDGGPRAPSSSRVTIISADEFSTQLLDSIGILVHTGFDDACPIGWMEAYLCGVTLVAPADGFVDAFVSIGDAHFYAPGYVSDVVRAMTAAVATNRRARPSIRELRASFGTPPRLPAALEHIVHRAEREGREVAPRLRHNPVDTAAEDAAHPGARTVP